MADLIDPLKADPIKDYLESFPSSEHWSRTTYGDPIKDDFRVFLTLLWEFLGLSAPTPLQLSIAYYLQHHGWTSEIDRLVIMGFRGVAKSFITMAFVLWNIHRNNQLKIGVVSGSGKRSVNFVSTCLTVIGGWDLLQYLIPTAKQRQSSTAFDVSTATPDQTPSIWSAGITSQIVGYRADIIVGDDVETNTNSMTQDMRTKISEGVKEFDSIIKPGGQIIFLGTPQTASSIYNELVKRGFTIQIWPGRFPTGVQQRAYGDKLAAYIKHCIRKDPRCIGHSTEPTRFTDADLQSREVSLGKAVFALQFMLDTSLADVDKYPLKLGDVICMSLDLRRGPDSVSWGQGAHLSVRDVQPIALSGDGVYGPSSVSESTSPYQAIFAFIDPSGRGKDETTLTIGAALHSVPFVLKQKGWMDGFGEETLKDIARLLVFYQVQRCRIEEDFGQGMFAKLLEPYVRAEWEKFNKLAQRAGGEKLAPGRGATKIESERAMKVQKEKRILEVLEPIFQSHRLVISAEVLKEDYHQVRQREGTEYASNYSLMYQITNLTSEKDCLKHDDRVEGLSGALNMMLDLLGRDPTKSSQEADIERMEAYLDKLDEEQRGIRSEGLLDSLKLRGKNRSGTQRKH